MGERMGETVDTLMKKERLANTVSFRYYKTLDFENNRKIDLKQELNSVKLQHRLLELSTRGENKQYPFPKRKNGLSGKRKNEFLF